MLKFKEKVIFLLFCVFFSWGFEVMQKPEWFAAGHRSVGAPRGEGPAAPGFGKSEETQIPKSYPQTLQPQLLP